jgi:hypothetical protein
MLGLMLELNKEKKEINRINLTIRENLIEIALEREYKIRNFC